MRESSELWFATSNEHKFAEAVVALGPLGFVLRRLPAKGVEIQSDDVSEIAKTSALATFELAGRPLFVEDTGLFVASLKGFPGPYSAFVSRTVGPEALARLLGNARDRDAEFIGAVAYCWGRSKVRVFAGRLKGRISGRPRGANGFGFDPVFIPEGKRKTLAEMTLEEKCEISHRSLALRALGDWLRSGKNR